MKKLLFASLFVLNFSAIAQNNVSIPDSNQNNLTTGVNNVGLGVNAGKSLTTGSRNVYLGTEAASGTTAAKKNDNVIIGDSAGFNIDAHRNILLGSKSGMQRNEGNDNVMIGYEAGWNNDKGDGNIYIGSSSGRNTNDGSDNVFIGLEAGLNNDNGDNNIFIGKESGKASDDGLNNIFIGKSSGELNNDGNNNTFIGYRSGIAVGNGSRNVALGDSAAATITGNRNIAIGSLAGVGAVDSENSIFIGADSHPVSDSASSISNSVAIGYHAMVGVDNAIVLGDTSNANMKVGIGTAFPKYRLDVKGVINMNVAYNNPGLKINGQEFIALDNKGHVTLAPFRLTYNDASEWSDHVFDAGYSILTIDQLQNYIDKNKHLPNIPSAKEVSENGIEIHQITSKLLEKIEEQSLYIIDLQKQINELKSLIESK